jgi:hypothetical protein
MPKQTVALYTLTSGDRVERARESLAIALGDAKLGEPDDAGVFELKVDAKSPKAARELVREAFARAGTGDDFVIREGTKGRAMPADDPRQGDTPDRSARVADAADAVAAAAAAGTSDTAGSDGDATAEAAATEGDAAPEAETPAREAVDEKGVGGAATDYASTAATAATPASVHSSAPYPSALA